jgi:hypothetical protein
MSAYGKADIGWRPFPSLSALQGEGARRKNNMSSVAYFSSGAQGQGVIIGQFQRVA